MEVGRKEADYHRAERHHQSITPLRRGKERGKRRRACLTATDSYSLACTTLAIFLARLMPRLIFFDAPHGHEALGLTAKDTSRLQYRISLVMNHSHVVCVLFARRTSQQDSSRDISVDAYSSPSLRFSFFVLCCQTYERSWEGKSAPSRMVRGAEIFRDDFTQPPVCFQ